MRSIFPYEMIRSELEEIVGQHFVSVDESDRLIYSTDWSWMPQMWLDRGERLPPPDYIVRGPNIMTSLPIEIPISYQEIAYCLDKSLSKVEAALLNVLEQTPPELYADIVNKGIYLAGGGALLRGLDKRLADKININFNVVEDPLHAVAKGTGVALKNVDKFPFLMR